MDSQELTDWAAYERLEPFGDRTTQMMIAQLTALVGSIVQEKGRPPIKVESLMPKYVEDADDAGDDWRAMKKRMMAITQALAKEADGKSAPKTTRKRG